MKTWIKFTGEKHPKYKQNTAYEVDQATADALIEAGLAEKTEAPKEVKDAGDAAAGTALKSFIVDEIKTAFGDLKKDLLPARKNPTDPPDKSDEPDIRVIASQAKRYGSLKNFANTEDGRVKAYRFGMFCLGIHNAPSAREKCAKFGIKLVTDQGVEVKTSRENINTSSGFLVADEFQNDMIDLREKFGVFRQNAKIIPMASDTRSDPRRVNGLTATFVGESTSTSLSDKQWDRVRLTAKKLMVLTKYSNELNEDAVLNIGDDLAGEIAYAFALKEDQCGFTGDGTSTFGAITGFTNALKNVSIDGNFDDVMGLVTASGTGYATSYNSIVLSDFNKVVATLPEYADVPGEAKWYVSKFFWGSVMQKLATAAGGNRVADVEGGALVKSFLGYPVVVSQVMPKVAAKQQVAALFGNLRLGARLGDRRMTSIMMSEHALNSFEQDEVAIRGTERFDIVVHDVGDPFNPSGANTGTYAPKSAQAGNVAGPVVGLITPNA